MVPFFCQDLSVFIRKVIEIIIKPKVLSDCNAAVNLKRIDLSESSILLNNKGINIGLDNSNRQLKTKDEKARQFFGWKLYYD